MKFDVILGNPPYKKGLHLKFLLKAVELARHRIIFIHPSEWLIKQIPYKRRYFEQRCLDIIEQYHSEFTFINGNDLFDVGLFSPISITDINLDLKRNGSPFIIKDEISGRTPIFKTSKDINILSDSDHYFSARKKILILTKQDNLQDHLYKKTNKEEGFFVKISEIRGHVNKKIDGSMYEDDFFTLVPRNVPIHNKPIGTACVRFNSEIEAHNFISFAKGNFARFALSLYKFDGRIISNTTTFMTSCIPWFDFSRAWTDNQLFELLKFSVDEINQINHIIPEYYINTSD